jgi:hypothetical protein
MFRKIPIEWHGMRTSIVLMLLLAATLGRSFAQTQAGYEAAFLNYAQATRSYDTRQMSVLMHPDAVGRLRKTIDAALRGSKKELAATELLPLFSVSSAADFEQLPDVEVYKLNDTIAVSSPELIEMMSGATYEIVGSFMKDELAYVTYNLKMTAKGKAVSTQVVQTLKMHDGKWLLMLPSTAEGAIAGIESRFP